MATITESYRSQQRELHENILYGSSSATYAPIVAQVLQRYGETDLLDYGAGKGRLLGALKGLGVEVDWAPYDPARPGWDAPPSEHRVVACIDVLEHVEPDCLDDVLADLARVTQRVGVFTVHTGPADKVLPDGRNAHLIQQPPFWWLPRIWRYFDVQAFQRLPDGVTFFVIVEPLEAA